MGRGRFTFHDVIAGLLFQIGKEHIDTFTSKMDDIEGAAMRKPWKDPNSIHEEAQQSINMLKFVLAELQDYEHMTIVIDRLDQCRWEYSDFQQSEALEAVAECFLELIQSVRCRLKVLLVMSSESARVLTRPSTASWLERRAKGRYLCNADWVHELERERCAVLQNS